MVGIPASRLSCPVLNSQHSQEMLRGKIVNVAEAYHWRCLEENGQQLENVDRTHLGFDQHASHFSSSWPLSLAAQPWALVTANNNIYIRKSGRATIALTALRYQGCLPQNKTAEYFTYKVVERIFSNENSYELFNKAQFIHGLAEDWSFIKALKLKECRGYIAQW